MSFTGLSFILRHMSGLGPQETPDTRETSESGETSETGEARPTRRWLRPMVARNTEEPHRASTPLELLFDLCFVVAVSQAARELNDTLSRDHFSTGLVGYVTVFFAIWWAWVNFTWFASAYDTDDAAYRLLTFVQIVGVLILAAGVPAAFVHSDFTVMTIGYVVMRVALVTQWLRAAAGDPSPSGRSAARRYAAAVTAVQVVGLPACSCHIWQAMWHSPCWQWPRCSSRHGQKGAGGERRGTLSTSASDTDSLR